MILAAGFGTRLRPHTETRPKALFPVAGRPMIEYPLRWLRAQGVTEVIINLHHLGAMIEEALGDGARFGLRILYSPEEEILGTGGGVALAMKRFGPGRLLLANADAIIDADLPALLDRHQRSGAVATLAMVQAPDPGNFTRVAVDEDGYVAAIGERPQAGVELLAQGRARALTFSGLSILEPELIEYLPADRFAHLAADGLIPALEDGRKLAAYFHRGQFWPLDSIDRVREAEREIAAGRPQPVLNRR